MNQTELETWFSERGVDRGSDWMNELVNQYRDTSPEELDAMYAEMCGDMA